MKLKMKFGGHGELVNVLTSTNAVETHQTRQKKTSREGIQFLKRGRCFGGLYDTKREQS